MQKITDRIDQRRLKELLHYDPETGIFTWLVDRKSVKAGDVAGFRQEERYWVIRVDGKNYLAHRLAWLYVTGEWPPNQIDHADLNKVNNKFANLRLATPRQNGQNKPIFRNNKSGVSGVSWNSRDCVWQSHMRIDGRQTHIGYFDNLFDAAAARFSTEAKHHTHRRAGMS
ncbi:MAG: HNH endonuclease [Gallionella sp.]|nr:HNH endonuclease [Gallionella sp.]